MAENVALATQLQAIQLGASLYDRAMQRERLNREENRLAEQLALQQKRFELERDESRLRQSSFETDATLKKMQLDDMINFNTNDKTKIGEYLKATSSVQSLDQFDKIPLPQLTSTVGRNQFEQIYKNDRNRVLGTSVQNAYNNAQAIQASAIETLSKKAPDLWIPVAKLMDPTKNLFQQSQEFQDALTENAKQYAEREKQAKEMPLRVAELRADALREKINSNQLLPPILRDTLKARLKAIEGDYSLTIEQKNKQMLNLQEEYKQYLSKPSTSVGQQDDISAALDDAQKIESQQNRPPLDSFFKR